MPQIPFQSQKPNPMNPNVLDVTVDEVFACKNSVKIIDVREQSEWVGELGHIAEAKLLTLGTLPQQMSQVPRDEVVVFVCRSGGRSAQATAFAKQSGYEHVFNMKGGMLEWNRRSLPIAK